MRGLSPSFLLDLQQGYLHPLIERVQLDRTLDLEIRDDCLNLYYRGGNLIRLARAKDTYAASFDIKYAKGGQLALPPRIVATEEDVAAWLNALPQLKLTMDLYFGRHPKDEREIQQVITRDNNVSGGRATDFFICDLEYANPHGRFDLIAVHWPSTSPDRKQAADRRLVIIEVKQGDGALAGKAGLHDHVRDVDSFLSDPSRVQDLKNEMVVVFNQKQSLGLLNCGRELESFGDALPMFLFILVNHDPEKSKLREELAELPPRHHCEVAIASSSLVGYGLFDPCLRTVEQTLQLPATLL